jgi:hypothetical protein
LYDKEWVSLMSDAKNSGLSVGQVQNFLNKEEKLLKVIKVNDEMVYRDVLWVRKCDRLASLVKDTVDYSGQKDDYRIEEVIVMGGDEFWSFVNDFLADFEFLEGKGGSNSTTANEAHEKPQGQWTDEEFRDWLRGSYRVSLVVMSEDHSNCVVVDPQGYNYARYVGLLPMKKFQVFYMINGKMESVVAKAPKNSVACSIAQENMPDCEVVRGREFKEGIANEINH